MAVKVQTFEIEIDTNGGNIEATVGGATGPCGELTEFLKKLGTVTLDEKTADARIGTGGVGVRTGVGTDR